MIRRTVSTLHPLFGVLLILWGEGCSSMGELRRDSASERQGSPFEILEDAGRITCDADTFEAVGLLSVEEDGQAIRKRIRWVFGPKGEYRFECGDCTAIHNLEYVYSISQKTGETALLPVWRYQLRMGPHRRYPGDMVMVAGAASGLAMTFPEAAQRIAGARWVADCLLQEDATFRVDGRSLVAGRRCIEIMVRPHEGNSETRFWIDTETGVMRKWQSRSSNRTLQVEYDSVSMNRELDESVFRIPPAAITAWEADNARPQGSTNGRLSAPAGSPIP